jgi:uncharacterized cupredoxin-like copper-binding protein
MSKFIKSLVLGVFLASSLGFAASAIAYYPTLSANYQGGNNNVQINISGAATYSQINLSYRQSSTLWTTVNNIGQTDQSGYFTQVISLPSDGSSSQVQMYATVGGQQTSTISIYPGGGSGCGYYGCNNVGGLTVNPSSLNLNVGQSASANVSMGSYIYSGGYYISSNSNSNVASASISGSTVNVYGYQTGSTTISICQSGASSSCVSLYVTVGGGSSYGNIYFSPSSLSLSSGQSSTVTIYNNGGSYYGNYYISSNSNSNVASASVSGNNLYVYALTSGTTNISVCQSGSSGCATLYVTVSGGSSGSLNLSQTSVSLSSGQTAAVTAYNVSGLYISSNSNSSVATASINGNTINIYGSQSGSTTISVCAYNSGCAYIYVTVSGGSSGSLSLSQTNVSLTVGQTVTVTAYNAPAIYVSSNSSPLVVNPSLDINKVNLYGSAQGSSTVYVCAISSSTQCASIYVTVSGSGSYGNIYFSPSSLALNSGQNSTVTIYNNGGYYGTYYISSNTNSNVASASISGNSLYINAITGGSTTITVCQNNISACATLYVTVNGGSSGGSGNLWFSPSSPSLYVGQSLAVSINSGAYAASAYGYSNVYYISSNSNPNVATASISGTVLNLYGSQNGSTNISICHSSLGFCSTLYVTVGSGGYYGYNGGGLQYPGNTVLGASTYANGQLISENGTVYIVYKNSKTGFASAKVFTALGYKFANVWEVGSSGLMDSGYVMTNAYSSHPWGSWIKSGSTVYFVHEQGLMPVPDWNTFLNNGGQASFIVNANSSDLRLPRLSPMTSNDFRLR